MSVEAVKATHHTEDWSRSSFFDVNSEMVKALDLESDEGSDNEVAIDSNFYSVNNIDINTQITDNPIMNEIMQHVINRFAKLIETGELPPTFMDKMRSNPQEIVTFIQENHMTIGDELDDKLDRETRPSLHEMVESGMIPNEYYPFITINDTKSKKITAGNDENEVDLNDDIKTEQIIIKSDGEKSKESDDTISSKEAAYIEELKGLDENKDEKIQELMAEIAILKDGDKYIEKTEKKEAMHHFSESRTKIIVENKMRLKHIGDIEAVKNEYNKILDDMQVKYKDLEKKHLDSIQALQDVERSKIELLRTFNGEMDRMRAEIKKYNSFCMMPSRKVNV